MFRRSSFALWILFAVAIALAPLACGGDTASNDSGSMSVTTADATTKS